MSKRQSVKVPVFDEVMVNVVLSSVVSASHTHAYSVTVGQLRVYKTENPRFLVKGFKRFLKVLRL